MPIVNIPFKLKTHGNIKTGLIYGDTHYPYQDDISIRLMESFMRDIHPSFVISNGDLGDFYQLSKFDKDPSRIASLQSDIDMVTDMFARQVAIVPRAKRIIIKGTHEHRFEKWLWSKAAELSSLRGLNLSELYKIKDNGFEMVEFEQGLMINDSLLILHGDIVSIHSAYTAKRQYEKHGGCGICNHTHRGGSFYKRDRFGTWGWWENFCLCSLNPDWIQNPNWQHGFSLVHFTSHQRFFVEQIPIIDNKLMYGGKIYG